MEELYSTGRAFKKKIRIMEKKSAFFEKLMHFFYGLCVKKTMLDASKVLGRLFGEPLEGFLENFRRFLGEIFEEI